MTATLAIRVGVAVAVLLWPRATPAAQPAPPDIQEILPDPTSDTITIRGGHFGTRVVVTLDLVPLDVRLAIDTRIVVAVPLAAIPSGEYLLTVSRGPGAGESATTLITLGASAASAPPPPPAAAPPASSADVAARVGDRAITIADLDREWQRSDPGGYAAAMQQVYEQRRRVAGTMVADDLLAREARARGVTVEALLAEEVPKRRVPLPDSAVAALYQSLGARAGGATLDELRPALRAWLERKTEPEIARMSYVEELMKTSTKADIVLAPPLVPLRTDGDPALGAAGAAVEIVVFGDLQSPDYTRLARAFSQVRTTFGDRVRIVFKGLPLFGAQSAPIAEAAACAHAQGRFWAFHDAALEPGVLDAARISALVGAAGVDREAYDRCVKSGIHRDRAQRSVKEAALSGITRGPAVVVNQRLAPEAPAFLPPFEFLTRLVEEALQQRARGVKGAPR